MQKIRLALIGFGNVGRAFATLLEQKRGTLERVYNLDASVVGIYTRTHGVASSQHGVDLQSLLDCAASGEPIGSADHFASATDFIHHCGADVLVENSSVNIVDGEPALSYMLEGLQRGMHIITANKGPIVYAYARLQEAAKRAGKQIRFESTVLDGAPIFSLWRETLPAASLTGFRGILNSTTNLILSLMEDGLDLTAAVRQAQDLGIAETDPGSDLQGWDAAIKVAVLVRVLLDIPFTPRSVLREGIEKISLEDVLQARQEDQRWKLVCEMNREGEAIQASVRPILLTEADPLYQIMGTSTAITFSTDVLGPVTISAKDPLPNTTAYGLLADLISLYR
ncbi:MAG: homoserine dehydrogenase [Anaerolineales bacterium]|nr:homoserine dehydrogenase [Anaerolineales bacterium]